MDSSKDVAVVCCSAALPLICEQLCADVCRSFCRVEIIVTMQIWLLSAALSSLFVLITADNICHLLPEHLNY